MPKFFTRGLAVLAGVSVLTSATASAMPRDLYLQLLDKAQRHVDQKRAAQGAALSGAIIKEFVGRYYVVGESWEVAAIRIHSAMSRMIDDPAYLEDTEGVPGIFRYEVIAVHGGLEPEVTLRITQLDGRGVPVADPAITKLEITVSDHLAQAKKAYFFKSAPMQAVAVDARGLRSRITPLETLPLDAPDLTVPRRQPAPVNPPSLPKRLEPIARSAAYHPNFGRATWLEEDDFFGRPVQALWVQGDPWPAYLKTSNGVAILLSKGAR